MENKLLNQIIAKIKRKFEFHLDYTGERVVPTEMQEDVTTWIEHLGRYVFALKFSSRKKILDIACGTGYGTALLSSVAESIVGIDIDKKVLKWAEKNNKFFCPVKFFAKDLDREEIKGKFDSIICFETIEHLENPKKFLKTLVKVTRNDGTIIFSVPIKGPKNRFHKHRFNWKSIENIVNKSFGEKTEWFSQLDQNILPGKNKKAKFAIGVWIKK